MHRSVRLSVMIAAALMIPGVAAAAESSGDLMAYLGDEELVLPPTMDVPEAAAAAFEAAVAEPVAEPAASVDGAADAREFASLSDDELGGQRGGFMTPLGLEVGFGAVIRTTIDGVLALETKMTWTDQGAETTNTFGSPTDPATAAATASAGGITLGPASNWNGIVAPGDGGATAVLHDLSQNAISSLIINTANNRSIKQETEITLSIPDFAAAQADMIAQATALRLQDSVGSALTAALPN